MTYEELREKDKEGAFYEWISVKGAKELGIIPKEFHEYFDDYCACGSENMIKETRTQFMCCNPRCKIKMGFALAEMLSRFGVKGLKEATCSKIYDALLTEDKRLKENGQEGLFKFDSFVEVVKVPWTSYPTSISHLSIASDFFYACQEIRSEPITFPKLASNLAIPDLSKDAEQLFSGFTSFQQVYDEIKKEGGVFEFCRSRGFYAPSVAFNLRTSIRDLAAAYAYFGQSLRSEGVIKLNICMTGSISLFGSSTTKDRYIKQCNSLCVDQDGVSLIEIKMTSAKESNPFILYSRESGDNKYLVGLRRGEVIDEFGKHPVLMHTDVFYKFLERMVDSWNQLKEWDLLKDPQSMIWQVIKDSMLQTLNPEISTTTSKILETSMNSKTSKSQEIYQNLQEDPVTSQMNIFQTTK